ncbi:oxalate decarboxylase family bicupin [Mesorhizobium sp. YC-39]|uniref:oxalate decarboxylase family bicupin n=1 Tax=unclassified Mesorhizobium TaxID=325217 RepID=UPI0021E6E3FA|nr:MULTISPECIES: oxalate decarboxylase family bicupin [unclassified Mesorhizobium]MCV3206484.1 oxalate decarboxylase family bicupin [Mesorhizobium sp. YC-2]MCV3227116.1 oxalate decarboxylase family bicupin [Mesorhizobium sp. YC-39]
MSIVTDKISRRTMLAATAAGGLLTTATLAQAQKSDPIANGRGGTNPGPMNPSRIAQNPDLMVPPNTDAGSLPNLRFSFDDAHIRLSAGGWTRQVTARELGVSKDIAGVIMRLNAGGVRELHWHKAAEWAYVLYGKARITAVDANGHNFVDDVGAGDLWYFPPGIPHSIQGLDPDGTEFLLVFDDGDFDEDNTFLLSDFLKHTPPEVLAKNFGVPASSLANVPDPSALYMFPAPVPGPLGADKIAGAVEVLQSFSHRMMAQAPIKMKHGTARITDSSVFQASKTIAAALVEVEPGAMRELHWHPNTNEWQYYIQGQARMGVFAASGAARTFDFQANDVGYVPFAMGHYIENTGNTTLRYLEVFKSDHFADVSLNQWLALTPPELVRASLRVDSQFLHALRREKSPVVPA